MPSKDLLNAFKRLGVWRTFKGLLKSFTRPLENLLKAFKRLGL